MNRSKQAGMGKRIIVVLLVSLALTSVRLAEAQPAKEVPRIGYLDPASPEASLRQIEAFRKGLAELGYVDGKNIVIEYRHADGKRNRLVTAATELSSAMLMSLLPALHLV